VRLALAAVLLVGSCHKVDDPAPGGEGLPARGTEALTVVKTKTGAEMVLIPAGRFMMGSTDGKPDEAPVHEVSIDAFLIDRTEVTQEQYGKLVVANPSHFKGPDRPVEQISWANAALYCNLRSRDEGLQPCYDEQTAKCNSRANGYRLPTEAEWEYACRAGSDGAYWFGSDGRLLKEHAWYAENASKKTQPVAQKQPNAWGLFDVHGNVAEWCNDVYEPGYYRKSPPNNPQGPEDGEKYVLRGGAWNSRPEGCRSAARVGENPGFQDACFARDAIGFRCVRRVAETPKTSEVLRPVGWGDSPSFVSKEITPYWLGLAPQPTVLPVACIFGSLDDRRPPMTGFVYDEVYLRHQTGGGHPERPERLSAIVRRLEKTGLLARMAQLKPVPAEEKWLLTVHAPEYVDHVRRSCQGGARFLDSMDTPVSKESFTAAQTAAGGVLVAVDAVVEGKLQSAFCAVRPPGHHATKNRAMGFCLLNNVAIAARYAQQKHKLAKVLIVDWDVHHGNGTQAAFDDDPTVFYFSIHQYPFYPGTGSADERGRGKALGTKLNVPLPAGSGDREYKRAFVEKLRPAALAFKPDLVLISAGFDAYEHDLLGGMKVSTEGFAELTRIVREIASQCCDGRLVSVLEGGYNLDGLAECVEAHVRVLME
jgi:acetoin utilization deacetylase AcuC-like enzyme/formylglycine-generating enzyme required for sulfatase activity